jgi:hypothetical protein
LTDVILQPDAACCSNFVNFCGAILSQNPPPPLTGFDFSSLSSAAEAMAGAPNKARLELNMIA